MSGKLICALDLSGPFASFAVMRNDEILFSESILLQNRNNGAFFTAFFAKFNEFKLDVSDIDKWIVGTGPGSFTGLRIASSFVSGVVYGADKTAVGISSAFPIAINIGASSGENIGVIFPCSKDTVYLCTLVLDENGLWIMKKNPEYLTKRELREKKDYHRFALLCASGDENSYKEFINPDIPVVFLNRFPVEKMLHDFGGNYSGIQDLLYLRPPSLTVKL